MRYLEVALVTVLLAACGTPPGARSASQVASATQPNAPQQQDASPASVAQQLLAAAAADFHNHRPPYPDRFRDVRFGHVLTASGEAQYLLCGQFLPVQEGGQTQWTPFATIKTSGYEQWLGAQATVFCQSSSVIWDNEGDLSSSLQSRLDTLR
jgi:hypothetical protein